MPIPGHSLALQLIALRHQIDLLELRFARLATQFDESGYWDDEGSTSGLDWIRFNCRMTGGAAASSLAVGENLARIARSARAVEQGEIGYAHLTVMARTADAVGKAFDEHQLLDLARKNSPGKFHFKCMHYRHSVDARSYQREAEEHVHNRRLSISTVEDGCLLIDGVLDPVGGAAVRAALEPLARKTDSADDRTREQRLADALVERVTGGSPVQLNVTSSVETLLGLAGAPGAEMEFSLPVSSTTVERWACDCNLSRVLLQDSVVIDVGRTRRVIDGATRKALKTRDGHCRWPGCERPASWCDGHHLVHWAQGGSTDLDNLVMLCRRHHRLVHEGGWHLVKTEDLQIRAIAPTVTFGRPREPDSSLAA